MSSFESISNSNSHIITDLNDKIINLFAGKELGSSINIACGNLLSNIKDIDIETKKVYYDSCIEKSKVLLENRSDNSVKKDNI